MLIHKSIVDEIGTNNAGMGWLKLEIEFKSWTPKNWDLYMTINYLQRFTSETLGH